MIYITGDTHNSEDISNLSSKNMKLCCMEQNTDFHAITATIVLVTLGFHGVLIVQLMNQESIRQTIQTLG